MRFYKSSQKWTTLFCFIVFLMKAGAARSAEDPTAMLQNVTNQVMAELRAHRQELQKNPSKIYTLVNHIILPHVDFDESAKWVVGRNAWREADSNTQQIFINEFKNLVVRSYAGSLLGYTDQKVEYLPLRGSTNKERIEVASLLKDGGKAPIRINYRLIQSGGSWRVYDIIIEGVSLMQGYHAQFAEDVKEGGVKAVIEKIRRRQSKKTK